MFNIKLIFVTYCYRTVLSVKWEIFSVFLRFYNLLTYEITAKHEKQGKYLSILHEASCDNYFIVKYLLKSNTIRVILLTNCIKLA